MVSVINFSSALTINDTTFFSSTTNYTIFVNQTINLSQIIVTSTAIEFYNLTTNNARFNNTNATYDAVVSFFGLNQPVNDIRHSNGTIISSSLSNLDVNVTIPVGAYIEVGDFSIDSITLSLPVDGSEDTDGFVTFSYNATDNAGVDNCTLTTQGVERSGEPTDTFLDTSITSGAIQSFTLSASGSLIISNRLQWFVDCTDSLGNTGESGRFVVDTLLGSAVGGGGGGGGFVNQTLSSEFICDKAFFLLIDNPDANVTELKFALSVDTSEEELSQFIGNYTEVCVPITGRELPFLDKRTTFPFLEINAEECSSDVNSTILGYDMDESLPFFKLSLKESSCKKVESLRWWFKLDRIGDGLSIVGIRLWWILTTIFIGGGAVLINSYFKTNKLIQRDARKR